MTPYFNTELPNYMLITTNILSYSDHTHNLLPVYILLYWKSIDASLPSQLSNLKSTCQEQHPTQLGTQPLHIHFSPMPSSVLINPPTLNSHSIPNSCTLSLYEIICQVYDPLRCKFATSRDLEKHIISKENLVRHLVFQVPLTKQISISQSILVQGT